MKADKKPALSCPQPCERNPACHRCKWLAQYYSRQKWINAYARKAGAEKSAFRYYHPTELARYRKIGPCPDCPVGQICDTPCPEYLTWFREKMQSIFVEK